MLSGLTLVSTEHPVDEVFPGEDQIPHANFLQLPIVLCVELRPHEFFSVFFGMFTGVIIVQPVFGQLH